MDIVTLQNFLLFLPLFLFLSAFLHRKLTNVYNYPPGPLNLPIVGNLHKLGELPHRSFYNFSQKYGPLVHFKLGSKSIILASSSEIAKEILKTNDPKCCSRPFLTSWKKLSYGFHDVAFAPYGQEWKQIRKICVQELYNTKKLVSSQSIREEEVDKTMNKISSLQGSDVNLKEELMMLANNIICRTALGKKFADDEGEGKLREILTEAQALFMAFFYGDYISMLGWLDVVRGLHARLDKNFSELDKVYQRVIEDHIRKSDVNSLTDSDEDVVDSLLYIQKTTPDLTTEHIKGILMNIFIAGTETASTVIEWVMTELMRHPEAMKKAQDEVRRRITDKKAKIEQDDIDNLPYLKSVVKETMRMHPPVPLLLQREAMEHFKINGYDIPPKAIIFINVWAIGRDPNVWEKPDEFCPERFMNSPIDYLGKDYELIPFGAGRRICPGMHMGIAVVYLALANLLYRFDWKLPNGMSIEDIDMSESPGITVHMKSALKLVAQNHFSKPWLLLQTIHHQPPKHRLLYLLPSSNPKPSSCKDVGSTRRAPEFARAGTAPCHNRRALTSPPSPDITPTRLHVYTAEACIVLRFAKLWPSTCASSFLPGAMVFCRLPIWEKGDKGRNKIRMYA